MTALNGSLLACAFLCLFLFLVFKHRRASIKHPPGPKGYPIIGNVFNMPKPTEKTWEIFAKWGAEFGGIISVNIVGQRIIILNDPDIAVEMFEKKSAIYSSRPTLPMLDLCDFNTLIACYQNTKALKECRKLMASVIGTTQALERFIPYEEFQSTMLLKRIMNNPEQFEQAIVKTTGAVVLQVTYGYKTQENGQDPLIHAGESVSQKIGQVGQPGRFMVNHIPFLRHVPPWFPFARGFHDFAASARNPMHILMNDSFEFVRNGMERGSNPPSIVGELLAGLKKDDESPSYTGKLAQIKYTAGTLYTGGTDSTAAALTSFLLAMLIWPEVQQNLQAEVDNVVGRGRLPTFQDRKTGNMPYVEAVVKELSRWFTIATLGGARRADADDTQCGYFIPKNSVVVPNAWYFLHDPKTYTDPFTFKPERFLGPNAERDPYQFAFGFGRRICPGMKLADLSVWFGVVKLAWAFNFIKAKNHDGSIIEPTIEQAASTLSHPVPFKCCIEPRDAKVMEMVEEGLLLSSEPN